MSTLEKKIEDLLYEVTTAPGGDEHVYVQDFFNGLAKLGYKIVPLTPEEKEALPPYPGRTYR